ncbi:hypothetical protein B0H14DRAFT_3472102 [Mycena olivaceomarginata]|nr:hypothetical protein B0H14DRAFT_3472102 [Mycena olivaceomarginata]
MRDETAQLLSKGEAPRPGLVRHDLVAALHAARRRLSLQRQPPSPPAVHALAHGTRISRDNYAATLHCGTGLLQCGGQLLSVYRNTAAPLSPTMVKDLRTEGTVCAASWRNPPRISNRTYLPMLRGVYCHLARLGRLRGVHLGVVASYGRLLSVLYLDKALLAATRATDDVCMKSERPVTGVSFSTPSELFVTAPGPSLARVHVPTRAGAQFTHSTS